MVIDDDLGLVLYNLIEDLVQLHIMTVDAGRPLAEQVVVICLVLA